MMERIKVPSAVTPDAWVGLTRLTPARLALGRAGAALPTRAVLALGMDHARARDAVYAEVDANAFTELADRLGLQSVRVASEASSRDIYLRRPDLGRRLDRDSRDTLSRDVRGPVDLAIVVADGLSASGVDRNAPGVIERLTAALQAARRTVAPLVIASQARVALGDPIGLSLDARLVLVLIGERPGLSAPDSLGAYLTFGPRVGRTDAERNCVSNIRPGGLDADAAAAKLFWLVERALALSLTGVALKDDSDGSPLAALG